MQKGHHKYIIVGAGISGLQAAVNLAEMGQDFIILEAQDRIGGRVCTLKVGQALKEDGVSCDQKWLEPALDIDVQIGATWICEAHINMKKLVQKYKLPIRPQYYEGQHILALNKDEKIHLQDYSQYYSQKKQKLLPLIQKLNDLTSRFQHLTQLRQTGKASAEQIQQLRQIYKKYDHMTGYDFIRNQVKQQDLAYLVDNQIQTLQSISSEQFTVIEFIIDNGGWHGIYHYLGIMKDSIDGYRLDNGLTQLMHAVKNDFIGILKSKGMNHHEKDIIKLNHPVATIKNKNKPVQIITEDGQIFTCDKVLMALPLGALHRIKFEELSQAKSLIFNNLLSSHVVRMTMIFPKPFWRDLNYSGNINFSKDFHMNELVELTPPDLSCGIVAFVFLKDGFEKWNHQLDSECQGLEGDKRKEKKYELNKAKCLQILADMYLKGDTKHEHLQKCVIFTRCVSFSPYIRNSYDSTTAPTIYYQLFERGLDNPDPFSLEEPNVIFIGSDFAYDDQGSGYMEGGINIAHQKVNKEYLQKA